MRSTIVFTVILSCVSALASSHVGAAEIAVGRAHAISSSYLGANIESAYSGSGKYRWTDPSTMQTLKALNLQSLRYPGGAAANFWDWQKGSGYAAFPTAPDSRNDSLETFAALAKAVSGPPVFNLNVMTYNNAIGEGSHVQEMIQYQIEMLSAAQHYGVPVQYIELGNEFYLNEKHYPERFPDGAVYGQEMARWVEQLRLAFPSAKIAIVGDYATPWRPWDTGLLANLPAADAVTLHRYDNLKDGDPVALLSNAFSSWEKFEKTPIPLFTARSLSIWMTEFAMVDKTPDHALASTWLHGMYDAEMLIQFLSEPAITQVDIYNFHSDNPDWPLVYSGTESFGSNGVKPEAGMLSASGQVISLFGRALAGATGVAALDLKGYGTIAPDGGTAAFLAYPALSGLALNDGSSESATGFMIVNLSSRSFALSLEQGLGQMEILSAANLGSNIVTREALAVAHQNVELAHVNIKPYSVSFIHNAAK